jgi:OOP family OmpA-OmpF porin
MDDARIQDNHQEPTNCDGLDELRRLLLGSDKDAINKLRDRLDNPKTHAQDVSRILPDAVILRSSQDKQLTKALMPTVEEAIGASIKRNPQRLVDIIFPVMGPAIRKAVSQAFSQMVQSLNQVLAQSFSIRSLRWRIEALRTGRSFAEVVLSHTLIYSVEQVFLIHRKTGLFLQQVAAKSAASVHADMISGMLSAVQDFVKDSFSLRRGDSLEALQVGDFSVWIEQGSLAILAATVRGNAPEEIRTVLQNALENVHVDQREALEEFQGDTAPFTATRTHLESCLIMQLQEKRKQPLAKKKKLLMFWSVLVFLLLIVAVWLFFSIRDNARWSNYLDRLNSQPGIVVVSSEKRDGKHFISGFRDPFSADPQTILRETKIDPEEVTTRWESFQSSYPEFVLVRAKDLLQPSENVSLKFENGILSASGFASRDWIAEARKLARTITGIERFQEDRLVDFSSLKFRIENQSLLFSPGTTDLTGGQNNTIERLIADIENLCGAAQAAGKAIRFRILGHTDKTGTELTNIPLSQKRAEYVLSLFASRGLKAENLKMAAIGATGFSPQGLTTRDRISSRTVTFRVDAVESKLGKQ